jgi:hypothetical protein
MENEPSQSREGKFNIVEIKLTKKIQKKSARRKGGNTCPHIFYNKNN